MSIYNYKRRKTREVMVGNIGIGGDNPIRIQSMTNTSTNDIEGSALQAKRIHDAGGELVRLTTQGVREAEALGPIREELSLLGCEVPLSADVHFNAKAAFKAAETADKVRINPGNFVDAARTFRKLEFSDEEYAQEIERIRESLVPFLTLCRREHTAVRLGVNHGSLSDRIMSRYGDTPAGMVESVMEYLRICREVDFHDIVISIKASNTMVMTETVRLLVRKMDQESMDYPLHLGVTEAGNAEDGRIKSAVGIGALLAEGLGDTIRVSLSEPPENEIPVAIALRDHFAGRESLPPVEEPMNKIDGISREYSTIPSGFGNLVVSLTSDRNDYIRNNTLRWNTSAGIPDAGSVGGKVIVISSDHPNQPGDIASWIDRVQSAGLKNPIIISMAFDTHDLTQLMIEASADFGALLLNGYGSGIEIRVKDEAFNKVTVGRLELDILQAARLRFSKTEYIACPSCGRTLFDLEKTLGEVKKATAHLKGLKIGVMGCIVNGPGEMADADYGYVGAGPGRVSIYRSKELVLKNIPTDEALPELLRLIESDRKAD